MADRRTKLELTWIGKEDRPRLEPRILVEEAGKSHHAPFRASTTDVFDNRLIYGDNLLALKALQQDFAGAVKCIYIDPPFNTGAAMENYDDGLEHSTWLTLMRERLEYLARLLCAEGSIFVHLDDNEVDYLKVVMDEVFGRGNFINRITVDARAPSAFSTVNPGVFKAAEYILWYAKDRSAFSENPVRVPRGIDSAYRRWLMNPDDPCTKWQFSTLADAFAEQRSGTDRSPEAVERRYRKFVLDNARHVFRLASISDTGAGAPTLAAKAASLRQPGRVIEVGREGREPIYVLDGQQMAFYQKNVTTIDGELTASQPLTNVWTDIAWEGIANEGGVQFRKGKKPERLVRRCLQLASKPGDLVLDSFAGSGTTGAVAHKMQRRWIMIELGDHCDTHILPRLRSVVDGTDSTGVTTVSNWKGGGGFRYFRLAPSLLEKDQFGNWVVNRKYNAAMLAEAMCKLEGFRYEPSDAVYWQHGRSSETDFLYVTTQTLGRAQLQHLSDEVGSKRTLLVLCGAYRARNLDDFSNLTVRKIPKVVLDRCEWGRDDYSLEIRELPQRAADKGPTVASTRRGAARGVTPGQEGLFDDDQYQGKR